MNSQYERRTILGLGLAAMGGLLTVPLWLRSADASGASSDELRNVAQGATAAYFAVQALPPKLANGQPANRLDFDPNPAAKARFERGIHILDERTAQAMRSNGRSELEKWFIQDIVRSYDQRVENSIRAQSGTSEAILSGGASLRSFSVTGSSSDSSTATGEASAWLQSLTVVDGVVKPYTTRSDHEIGFSFIREGSKWKVSQFDLRWAHGGTGP